MSTAAMHDETGDEFDLVVTWELDPKSLVSLLYLNDRRWDINGVLRVPTEPELEAKARELIEALREFGGGAYITLNGLKVYVDPEMPDSYEIYFLAGYASPRIPEDSK